MRPVKFSGVFVFTGDLFDLFEECLEREERKLDFQGYMREREGGREGGRERERETKRDRHTDNKDRQGERQRYKHTHIHIYIHTYINTYIHRYIHIIRKTQILMKQ